MHKYIPLKKDIRRHLFLEFGWFEQHQCTCVWDLLVLEALREINILGLEKYVWKVPTANVADSVTRIVDIVAIMKSLLCGASEADYVGVYCFCLTLAHIASCQVYLVMKKLDSSTSS
ncbi:hypothetical protein FCV25MIE_17713 [Fagus crenata]